MHYVFHDGIPYAWKGGKTYPVKVSNGKILIDKNAVSTDFPIKEYFNELEFWARYKEPIKPQPILEPVIVPETIPEPQIKKAGPKPTFN